jgi:hypothetical protein
MQDGANRDDGLARVRCCPSPTDLLAQQKTVKAERPDGSSLNTRTDAATPSNMQKSYHVAQALSTGCKNLGAFRFGGKIWHNRRIPILGGYDAAPPETNPR